MLEAIETVIGDESPDAVLVYGDTNSTLAAGARGAKLHVPVAHVEAGLRSFNRRMPRK
jgi:UDP-N-acetylglucosamine 2-epimerase